MTECWSRRLRTRALVQRSVLVSALTLGAVACTEPEFVLATDVDGDALSDAGMEGGRPGSPSNTVVRGPSRTGLAKDVLPTWADEGFRSGDVYAMRARFYSRAPNGAEEWHELVARAEINIDLFFKVTLTTLICASRSELHGDVTTTRKVDRPQSLEKRIYPLLFDSERQLWYSAPGRAKEIGYDSQRCLTDTSKLVPPPWLRGRCNCPGEGEPDGLPTKAEDCRVTDADQDQLPGLSIRLAPDLIDRVVIRDGSGFQDGKLGAGRMHTASFKFTEKVSTVDCAGEERSCEPEESRGCSSSTNPVEFVPDPKAEGQPPFNCDSIMKLVEEKKLFRQEDMAFPSGC